MPRPRKQPTTSAQPERLAVVYARVSTQEQRQEGYSIDAQLALLRTYATEKGITIVEELIEADSASRTGRPQFSKMIKLVRDQNANIVLVEKTDRLTRSVRDYSKVQDLIHGGAEVHCVKEREVYTRDSRSHATFVFGIKVVVAELFSNNLSEEIRKGMSEKAMQGYWPSTAPYGYVNVLRDGRRIIEPDPDVAPKIRRLFETYATGDHSMAKCAEIAASFGLRGKRGGRLALSEVHKILTNPVHIGKVVWNGLESPGRHVPTVDMATWASVQAVIQGRGATKTGTSQRDYIFKGSITCAKCGCAVTPYTVKERWVYYACTGYKGCKRVNVREDCLIEQVAEVLDGVTLLPATAQLLVSVLKEQWGNVKDERSERIGVIRQKIGLVEHRLEKVYLDNLDGKSPDSTYYRLRDQLTAELSDLRQQESALANAGTRTLEDITDRVHALSNCARVFRFASNDVRRDMFRAMVSNSTLDGQTLSVTLRDWFKLVFMANQEAAALTCETAQKQVWYSLGEALLKIDLAA